MSYTPGPMEIWGVVNKIELQNFIMIGPIDSDIHGCTAYVCSEHDAKLYAAAPDLLEALEEALPGIEELNGEFQEGWDSTINKMKAALNKARGI